MYSVKIFPGEGRSLKEYPTKHYPKKKTPHKGGPALLQLIQTGGRALETVAVPSLRLSALQCLPLSCEDTAHMARLDFVCSLKLCDHATWMAFLPRVPISNKF